MMTQAEYEALSDQIASDIEPSLTAAVDDARDQILAGLGFLARFVAARMWSAMLALVPILARVALAAILSRFGETTVNQIMDLIYAHKAAEAAKKDDPK